ncbi:MAG: SDR family NAD(P)-dependent oxidoreductase [bacterium]|nr:SDR family NAD(P)-dependent oxidoreductase [bacterium]
MKLKNKTAVITGAGRGIGLAIAKKFAHEGARLVLNDINPESVEAAAEEISKAHRKAISVAGDVGDPTVAASIAERAVEAFEGIDILVNNAGVSEIVPFLETSQETWETTLRTNLTAAFLMCKAVIPTMLERGGGSIVNIGSVAGKQGTDQYTAYCASKAGLIGLTQSLAREFASRQIRINAICPGIVATPMWEEMAGDYATKKGIPPEEVAEYITGRIPLNRLCTVEDVAELALYLASDEAGYMTGQAISLTGGLVMT